MYDSLTKIIIFLTENPIVTKNQLDTLGVTQHWVNRHIVQGVLERNSHGQYQVCMDKLTNHYRTHIPMQNGVWHRHTQTFIPKPGIPENIWRAELTAKIQMRAKIDNLLIKEIIWSNNTYQIAFLPGRCNRNPIGGGMHIVLDSVNRLPEELQQLSKASAAAGKWELASYYTQLHAIPSKEPAQSVLQYLAPELKQMTPMAFSEGHKVIEPLPKTSKSYMDVIRAFASYQRDEPIFFDQKTRTLVLDEGFLKKDKKIALREFVKTCETMLTASKICSITFRVLPYLGVALSTANVVCAQDKVQAATHEIAGTVGAIAGGAAATAIAGASLTPWGLLFIACGSMIGCIAVENVVQQLAEHNAEKQRVSSAHKTSRELAPHFFFNLQMQPGLVSDTTTADIFRPEAVIRKYNTNPFKNVYIPLPKKKVSITKQDTEETISQKLDDYFEDIINGYPASTKTLLKKIYYENQNVVLVDTFLKPGSEGLSAICYLSHNNTTYTHSFEIHIDINIFAAPLHAKLLKIHEIAIHVGQHHQRILEVGMEEHSKESKLFQKFTELSVAPAEKYILQQLISHPAWKSDKKMMPVMHSEVLANYDINAEMPLREYLILNHYHGGLGVTYEDFKNLMLSRRDYNDFLRANGLDDFDFDPYDFQKKSDPATSMWESPIPTASLDSTVIERDILEKEHELSAVNVRLHQIDAEQRQVGKRLKQAEEKAAFADMQFKEAQRALAQKQAELEAAQKKHVSSVLRQACSWEAQSRRVKEAAAVKSAQAQEIAEKRRFDDMVAKIQPRRNIFSAPGLPLVEILLKEHPEINSADGWCQLAKNYIQGKKDEKHFSIDCLELAVACDPNHTDSLCLLGCVYSGGAHPIIQNRLALDLALKYYKMAKNQGSIFARKMLVQYEVHGAHSLQFPDMVFPGFDPHFSAWRNFRDNGHLTNNISSSDGAGDFNHADHNGGRDSGYDRETGSRAGFFGGSRHGDSNQNGNCFFTGSDNAGDHYSRHERCGGGEFTLSGTQMDLDRIYSDSAGDMDKCHQVSRDDGRIGYECGHVDVDVQNRGMSHSYDHRSGYNSDTGCFSLSDPFAK